MNTKGLVAALTLGLGLLLGMMWLVSDSLPVVHADSIPVDDLNDASGSCDHPVGCSLREAIIEANGTVQADTIILGTGTHHLSIGGAGEDAAYTGDLDISEDLTIVGAGPLLTRIDADETLEDRIFDLSGTVTVVISGVTIMNGSIDGDYGGGIKVGDAHLVLYNTYVVSNTSEDTNRSYGGGLYVSGGDVTLYGGKIHGNLADGTIASGGGLYVDSGQATINDADITDNTVTGTNLCGAGVYVGGGQATITGGTITGNSGKQGGGVYAGEGQVTISGTHIMGNTGTEGAGVYVHDGMATISGAQISGNTSQDGAGVYFNAGEAIISGGKISGNEGDRGVGVFVDAGQATINGVQISGNTADAAGAYGAGVFVRQGQATIIGALITGNATDGTNAYGVGVFIESGSATISQTYIFNNQGLESLLSYGGGLYVDSGSATLFGGRVYSCTAEEGGGVYVDTGGAELNSTAVYSNSAEVGGGMYNNGGITLTNVTLSHNGATADEGGGIYNTDEGTGLLTFVTLAYNEAAAGGNGIHSEPGGIVRAKNTIVMANGPVNCSAGIFSDGWNLDSGNTCGFTKPSDQRNTNPQLGPLQGNGGGTLTHALQPGSRAIDAGLCLAPIPRDQRGRARPNPGSSFCDIGAYEASAAGFTNLMLSKRVTPASAAPGDPVTYTLEFSHTGPSGAVRVKITDSVPVSVTGVTFTNTGATITPLPGTPYVWRVEDLLPRAGGIITINGVLSLPLASGTFTNEAVITSSAYEPLATDNWGRAALTVLNVAPDARADGYHTPFDTPLAVAAPGVLDNDSDGNGDSLQAGLDGDVTSGTLSLQADGSFLYTPDSGFEGLDHFTYRASDGLLSSDPAAVYIFVGKVSNQAPIADAGQDQTVEASALVTLDGSGSTDPDGQLPLTYGWSQSSGPAVSVSDSGAVSPIFTAPTTNTRLVFSLVVTDALGLASQPDDVVVTVGAHSVFLPLVLRNH